jgi:glutamate/tyrosine decarboxylase-like PLP-dependent enzyme
MIIDLAASGGAVIPFPRPLKQTTVNNNWTATLSVNTVTVHIFVQAEKNV